MITQKSMPSITILPRLAFGALMPSFCEAAVNPFFKPKNDDLTQPSRPDGRR